MKTKETVSVRLKPELKEKLETYAESSHRSQADAVRFAIEELVGDRDGN